MKSGTPMRDDLTKMSSTPTDKWLILFVPIQSCLRSHITNRKIRPTKNARVGLERLGHAKLFCRLPHSRMFRTAVLQNQSRCCFRSSRLWENTLMCGQSSLHGAQRLWLYDNLGRLCKRGGKAIALELLVAAEYVADTDCTGHKLLRTTAVAATCSDCWNGRME